MGKPRKAQSDGF